MAKIDEQRAEMAGREPANLEEQSHLFGGAIFMKS